MTILSVLRRHPDILIVLTLIVATLVAGSLIL